MEPVPLVRIWQGLPFLLKQVESASTKEIPESFIEVSTPSTSEQAPATGRVGAHSCEDSPDGLLADDEVGGGYVALGGGGVPEDAIGAGSAGREAGGVENLDGVARPFAFAG